MNLEVICFIDCLLDPNTSILVKKSGFSFYILIFDTSGETSKYEHTANGYRMLRDEYLSLIACYKDDESVLTQSTLEQLQSKYDLISNQAPSTNLGRAYEITQDRLGTASLKNKGTYTWSDDEINLFLPEGLKF